MRRLIGGAVAFGFALAAAAGLAKAQDYPQKPVRIIVSFAPGGATDVVARKIAQKLTDHYKQSFIVENRPGAGGTLGTTLAARAPNDGYTLFLAQVASHGVTPNLYAKLDYDAVKDFTPIGIIAESPQVMVVSAKSDIKSVADFVAFAKKNSGRLTYASSGIGTTIHMAGEMFNNMVGVKMVHVPFQGSGPAVTAMIANQANVMFDDLPSSMPHIQSGALRALAITTLKRAPSLPDLPTLSEAGAEFGLKGFDASAWFALLAPANLPAPIRTSLNEALNKALASDDMKEFLAGRGATPVLTTSDEASAYIRREIEKWGKVIKDANIQKLQ